MNHDTPRDGLTWVEEELESARADLVRCVDRVDALVDLRSLLFARAQELGTPTLTVEQVTFPSEVEQARFNALAQRVLAPDERNPNAQA